MKRIILLVIIFIFYNSISFAKSKLTKNYLSDNQWGYDYFESKGEFSFIKDGTFGNVGKFGGGVEGKYFITDSTNIILIYTLGNDFRIKDMKDKKIFYTLKYNKNEIYPEKLVSKDITNGFKILKNWSLRQKPGSIIRIKPDLDIVIMKQMKVKTTANLNFRDYPDLKGNNYYIQKDTGEVIPYLKQGRVVLVEARTELKIKIGQYRNYWYLINIFEEDEYDRIYLQKGKKKRTQYYWIYGEFAKPI